jgi:hypothetical protein
MPPSKKRSQKSGHQNSRPKNARSTKPAQKSKQGNRKDQSNAEYESESSGDENFISLQGKQTIKNNDSEDDDEQEVFKLNLNGDSDEEIDRKRGKYQDDDEDDDDDEDSDVGYRQVNLSFVYLFYLHFFQWMLAFH